MAGYSIVPAPLIETVFVVQIADDTSLVVSTRYGSRLQQAANAVDSATSMITLVPKIVFQPIAMLADTGDFWLSRQRRLASSSKLC